MAVSGDDGARSGKTGAGRGTEEGRGVLHGAFTLLRALHEAGGQARLTALSDRSGLPASTAHRLLQQLAAEGAVEYRSRRYVLGPALHELGQGWEPLPGLRDAARQPLRELARTGASSALIVAREDDVLVLERAEPHGRDAALDPRSHGAALVQALRLHGRAAVRGAPDAHHACAAATVSTLDDRGLVALAALLPEHGPVDQLARPLARVAATIGRHAAGAPPQ